MGIGHKMAVIAEEKKETAICPKKFPALLEGIINGFVYFFKRFADEIRRDICNHLFKPELVLQSLPGFPSFYHVAGQG